MPLSVCAQSEQPVEKPAASEKPAPTAQTPANTKPTTPQQTEKQTSVPSTATLLLNGPTIDPKAWVFVSAKRDAKPAATWKMEQADGEYILECTGQPFGLIRTVNSYEDFRFGLEWRFPKGTSGNSGVLLHTGTEQALWPRSIQVQFHTPELGAVVPVAGARFDLQSKRVDVKPVPHNEWNRCVISSEAGLVSVEINGQAACVVTGCDPRSGCLGLQSEGTAVQFRRIWVEPVDSKATTPPAKSIDETARQPSPKPAPESTTDGVDLREPVPVGINWNRYGDRFPVPLETSQPVFVSGVGDVCLSRRAGRVLSRRLR